MLAAVSDHALLEATVGAYVAQEMATGALSAARAALAQLLGMPDEGVAFVESATVALSTLLDLWPFGAEPSVGVAPSEWGPNLAAFTRRGLRLVELPVDDDGYVDVAGLERMLASTPLSAIHITQVASHRSLVQPVAAIASVCHAAAVPLFVDAAQALGHVDTATGADVIYATSRKWLAGPRGVGVLAVASAWSPGLRRVLEALEPGAPDEPIAALLSSRESHVAGRIGLGHAAREHRSLGPPAVWRRLAAVGRATRQLLQDLDNWQVIGPVDDASAISALRPTAGQDVTAVRARLLGELGIVTTAQQVFRAPREMRGPTLRVSPHVDTTSDDLVRLRDALGSL